MQSNIQPTCPQCGAYLVVKTSDGEVREDDPVSCPTHGLIGTAKEVRDRFPDEQPEEFRRQAEEQARNAVLDMLRKAGFEPEGN